MTSQSGAAAGGWDPDGRSGSRRPAPLPDGPCALLGMSPSGELVIIRDSGNKIWLVSIYAPAKRITAATFTQFVARDAVLPVDRAFENWRQLDDYRRENIRPLAPRFPAYADYTVADVLAALRDAATAEGSGEITAAHTMLAHIAEQAGVVRSDTDLRGRLARRIAELQEAAVR